MADQCYPNSYLSISSSESRKDEFHWSNGSVHISDVVSSPIINRVCKTDMLGRGDRILISSIIFKSSGA